jgi:hypothetical protein
MTRIDINTKSAVNDLRNTVVDYEMQTRLGINFDEDDEDEETAYVSEDW